MKRTLLAATLALLLWGAPAFAGSTPDTDGDGVIDSLDNCSAKINSAQNDTDLDDCGNLCDADYDQTGVVDFGDFGGFASCFGVASAACEEQQHVEPISAASAVDFGDFGYFASAFGAGPPGPSGTTASTVACP
jgi:hypothetical protein